MGKWKHSGTIKLPFFVAASFLLSMPDGTILGLFRNGEVLEHWTRGSRNPFPWKKQATIKGRYGGSGNVILFRDGNYLMGWPDTNGVLQTWWSKPSEWPDPSESGPPPPPPPPVDKKLSVENGQILYGGEPIKLCGVSRWEALWRETGAFDFPHDWGEYNLAWYEKQLIDSGINYVRHGGVRDTAFLYSHCERMKDAGIIVEVTVYRVNEPDGVLVNLEDMGELAKLGNVFFDVCNEFIGSEEREVAKVMNIANNLLLQGCIVSAGAWSGDDGKALSDIFHSQFDDHQIETHHREWEASSFAETVGYNKPVVFNEYFAMREQLSLKQIKDITDTALESGCQGVGYYGFRDVSLGLPGLTVFDPFDYKLILKYAGELAQGG